VREREKEIQKESTRARERDLYFSEHVLDVIIYDIDDLKRRHRENGRERAREREQERERERE